MKAQGTQASPPVVRPGETIVVEELRMLCTGVVDTISGVREYEFQYFSGGVEEEWRASEPKLNAIGWKKYGGRDGGKGF